MATESLPPFPPFTLETAQKKVKAAQNVWNTRQVPALPWGVSENMKAYTIDLNRNPENVKMAYTPDSIWRNRDSFLQGRDEIVKFLKQKWHKENGYRLRKELFAFVDNKVGAKLASWAVAEASTGPH